MNPSDRARRKENWKEISAGFNALENNQVAAYATVVIRHDDPKPYYGFFAGDNLEDARKLLVKVDMIKSFLVWLIERARSRQEKFAPVEQYAESTDELKQTLPWIGGKHEPDVD